SLNGTRLWGHKLTGSTLRYPAFNPDDSGDRFKIPRRRLVGHTYRNSRRPCAPGKNRSANAQPASRRAGPPGYVAPKLARGVSERQSTRESGVPCGPVSTDRCGRFAMGAAWTWCDGHPHDRAFISGDRHLLDAARQLGFTAIEG